MLSCFAPSLSPLNRIIIRWKHSLLRIANRWIHIGNVIHLQFILCLPLKCFYQQIFSSFFPLIWWSYFLFSFGTVQIIRNYTDTLLAHCAFYSTFIKTICHNNTRRTDTTTTLLAPWKKDLKRSATKTTFGIGPTNSSIQVFK